MVWSTTISVGLGGDRGQGVRGQTVRGQPGQGQARPNFLRAGEEHEARLARIMASLPEPPTAPPMEVPDPVSGHGGRGGRRDHGHRARWSPLGRGAGGGPSGGPGRLCQAHDSWDGDDGKPFWCQRCFLMVILLIQDSYVTAVSRLSLEEEPVEAEEEDDDEPEGGVDPLGSDVSCTG